MHPFTALRGRLAVLSLLGGIALASLASPAAIAQETAPAFVPNEVLLQFKRNYGPAQRSEALARVAATVKEHILTRTMADSGYAGIQVLSIPGSVSNALRALENHPAVEFAEPNWIYTHQATADDPYYSNGSLWGMYGDATTPANLYGSQAGEAWATGYTGSDTVYVGVIDEGIQHTHPDLAANVWTNSLDPADGVDNDGNGKVDDIHGWDFDGNNNTVYDGTGDDHGTHVAGTIGAKGGNTRGVAGVSWNVRYISAKFLGSNGGTTDNAIKAVDYITDLKTRHNLNIVATNNSWGGGSYSQGLHDAIIRAAKKEILFIAAAGNGDRLGRAQNNDTTARYPCNYDTSQGTSTEGAANYDAVISVAAIDSSGNKASWSNYGATTVDLGAPGVGIYSTVPTDTYASYNGTSMATPHVTGGAALYASTHPGVPASEIKNALLDAARSTPTSSLSGKTVTGGRLNLSDIIVPPTAPAAPTNLAAVPGDNKVSLSWTASAGATGYNVYRSTTEGVAVSAENQINTTVVTDTAFSDTTVTNGTAYFYVVTAVNLVGESANSVEVSATPDVPTAPSAPLNLMATAASSTQVNLSWTDNSSNEAGFNILRSTDNVTYTVVATVPVNAESYSDTGLSPETTYMYIVQAYNEAVDKGNSDSASATTLPTPTLNVTVSFNKPDPAVYKPGETVDITVHATDGLNAVGGASVQVRLTTAGGKVYTTSGTTGTEGRAVFSYRTSKKDGKGTYLVESSVVKSGYNSGNGSNSFKVLW
ncbi:MAG: S8 family serine peptidase [Armatimonadetes bacterium]|nr:S8 family serine peptidase [Armatimonadota bacterium]